MKKKYTIYDCDRVFATVRCLFRVTFRVGNAASICVLASRASPRFSRALPS